MAKVKSRTWTTAAFGACCAAVAIIAWLELDRRRLRAALAEVQSAVALQVPPHARSPLAASRRPPEATTPAPAVPTSPGPSAEWIEMMRQQWTDPRFRAEALDAAFVRIEARHGRLFEQLANWSPERKDQLKALLAENEIRQMQATADELLSSLGGDQTVGTGATTRVMAENRERLRAMMDAAEFAQLERLERAESARNTFHPIINALRAKGVPVSGEREEQLLLSYTDVLRDAAEAAGSMDPSGLTAAQQAELGQRQHEALRVRLVQGMSSLLDEAELATFLEAHIEQHPAPGEYRRSH